jgi:hypothetical protein
MPDDGEVAGGPTFGDHRLADPPQGHWRHAFLGSAVGQVAVAAVEIAERRRLDDEEFDRPVLWAGDFLENHAHQFRH